MLRSGARRITGSVIWVEGMRKRALNPRNTVIDGGRGFQERAGSCRVRYSPGVVLAMPQGARINGPDRVSSSVVAVDADGRGLRESLKRLSDLWKRLEPGTAQRVRFLLTEVVSRLSDPRRRACGPISVRLDVLESFVRIEITGPGLHAP